MKTVKVACVIMFLTLVAATAAASAQASAQQGAQAPIVKLLNEIADSPEQHLAVATYYRTLASDALAEAEKHRAMRDAYRHNHQRFKTGAAAGQSLQQHCNRLIELHEAAAREYEELAMLHEIEASAE
jgi:hypothetical protein